MMRTQPTFVRTLAALFLLAGFVQAQIVTLTGPIYDGQIGPLTTGTFHANNISVPAGETLTISGVNIKFNDNTSLTVNGTLDTSQGAFFTSVHDDAVGGDTNGNGGATVPQRGDWQGVRFSLSAQDSILNASVRYAGRGGNPAVRITGTSVVSMFGGVIGDSDGPGVDWGPSRPTWTNSVIAQCTGVAAIGTFPLLDNVTNCAAWNNDGGNYVRRVQSSTGAWPPVSTLALGPQHTLNLSGVMVVDGVVTVPPNEHLLLDNGVNLKMTSNGGFLVRGDFELRGTPGNPAVVTSIFDDTVNGDTNLDGAATMPATGDWRSLRCDQSNGHLIFDNAEIRYAGGSFSFGGAVLVGSSRITCTDTRFTDITGFGIDLAPNQSSPHHHTIAGCTFHDVSKEGISEIPIDDVPNCRDNQTTGTTPTQIIIDPTLRQSTEIDHNNLPNGIAHVLGTINVGAGNTLTLHSGIWLKFAANRSINGAGGTLELRGTADAPIQLTSIDDDSVGGDTNGNGTATVPAPGDWNGIYWNGSSQGHAEHVRVRFANRGVYCQSTLTAMRSVRTFRCNWGMWLSKLQGNLENCVIAESASDGIYLSGSPSFDIVHCSIGGSGAYGIESVGFTGDIRNSVIWDSGNANLLNIAVSQMHSSCGAYAGQNNNINVDPQWLSTEELTIPPSSPLVNQGDLLTAAQLGTDIDERNRIADWDFSGSMLPDIGAHEFPAAILFDDTPWPELGDTVTLNVLPVNQAQHAGLVALAISTGWNRATAFVPTWGSLNLAPTFLVFDFGLSSQQFALDLPADPAFVGELLSVQGLLLPTLTPGRGHLTNTYRIRLMQP